MASARRILIVGGGTAGWLAAAYLAKAMGPSVRITLLESPEIPSVGVGEGTFPTIRDTLRFLAIEEVDFVRKASATFKQGVRFEGWQPPRDGQAHSYFHPFEPPFYTEDTSLVPYWLLQDATVRPSFAQAMTIQGRVAEANRAPKQPDEGNFAGPLNYAFHFNAAQFAGVLADRARSLGVEHRTGRLDRVMLDEAGAISHIETDGGSFAADLFVDCTGLRAELIGGALRSPFRSVAEHLFTDRALTCRLPYDRTDAPIESYTVATAHEAGWLWDIGLPDVRGIGCVYSSRHIDDDRAADILNAYTGQDVQPRLIDFSAGYRERQWIGNCVAVGLSAGFLEPLESTGVVLIEAAVRMIAEFFPHQGPADLSAARFNELMTARYDNIVAFLKLHYCLSRRPEPFWRDNADPATVPARLRELLAQWCFRPPSRFDFTLDVESFAFFNYQYILYGMGFDTDLSQARGDFSAIAEADRLFARIRSFGERATHELPSHRALVQQLSAGPLSPARKGS